MAKHSLRGLLVLVGLVMLTFSALEASSLTSSAGSVSAAGSTLQSTASQTPIAHATIRVTGKVAMSTVLIELRP